MSSITITLTNVCSGGDHLTITTSGAVSGTHQVNLSDVTQALTDEDMRGFVRALIRLGKVGRTNAQLRTLFEAGVTVTV